MNVRRLYESNPDAASGAPVTPPSDTGGQAETTTVETESTPEATPGDAFLSQMVSEFENDEAEALTVPGEDQLAPQEGESESQQPTEAPAAETPEETPAPEATEETPAPAPKEETPEAPVAAQPDQPPSEEDLAKQWEEHRNNFLPQLEKEYALDDETREALANDPSSFADQLPKMMADLHYKVMTAVYNGVHQLMPQMIDSGFNQRQAAQDVIDQFYSRFPDLKGVDGAADRIISNANLYRQMNPGDVNQEDLFDTVGLLTMRQLKIEPTPAAPEAPPAPSVTPAVETPVGVGTGPAAPPPSPSSGPGTIIDSMVAEFVNDAQ